MKNRIDVHCILSHLLLGFDMAQWIYDGFRLGDSVDVMMHRGSPFSDLPISVLRNARPVRASDRGDEGKDLYSEHQGAARAW